MSGGVSIIIEISDLKKIDALVSQLTHPNLEQLMTDIGALGESQTRARISAGGPAPDGTAWKANLTGTPILKQTGRHLLDSIAYTASAASAEWGAAWEFAHVHQYGAVIKPVNAPALVFASGKKKSGKGNLIFAKSVTIPARPFVGLSAENKAELKDLVTDFLGRLAA